MNIYDTEEVMIGNYFKINYLLARQLIIIFDIFNQRILDATLQDLSETILETSHHFENKIAYSYDDIPMGWHYYISQSERHTNYKDFINWFFRYNQQPKDYLISGIMKHRSEKRNPIKEDRTATSTEYGGVPIEIDNGNGYKPHGFTKRF